MTKPEYPEDFLALLSSVTAKRPKTVIDHILQHGQITTEEIKETYGYNHPPRAIRDVREQGVPVITFRVEGSDGRKIAAYKFGDPSQVRNTQLSGRTAFSNQLRKKLIEKYGSRCNIYLQPFPESELQIDHRIPFEIAGDGKPETAEDEFMLLCASANRAKSWSCENCPNWTERSIDNCKSCYWAFPESYMHVAMRNLRRLDVLWVGEEVTQYERVRDAAIESGTDMPDYVKRVLEERLNAKGATKT